MVCIPRQGVYFRRCWQGAIESAFTHILTLSFIRRNCFSFFFSLFYFFLGGGYLSNSLRCPGTWLYRPGWLQTHRGPPTSALSSGIKGEGVRPHTWLEKELFRGYGLYFLGGSQKSQDWLLCPEVMLYLNVICT